MILKPQKKEHGCGQEKWLKTYNILTLSLLFFFWPHWGWNSQPARQVLYHLSHCTSPFFFVMSIFEISFAQGWL
jgi:hypothetical protein